MKRSLKIGVLTLAGLLATVTMTIAFGAWVMNSHGGDLAQLARVSGGMTMAQTEAVLGKPWKAHPSDDGATWIYGHPFKWCMFVVHFDRNGKVSVAEHDH